jgi:hypothetical protein
MAKVTSLTPDEQDTLRRLGSKLPSGVAKQDRAASSPVKEQKSPVAKARSATKNTKAMDSECDGSPGSHMGGKWKGTPAKISTHKASKS